MKKIGICICLLFISTITVFANTREQASLVKCVDGDTTHFNVQGNVIKVRYLAINAPEYTKEKEPYGKQASEFVCDILTKANTITLEYDDGSDLLDKYGRTLAWVYADDKLVQKELVAQGLAEVKYLYGDYAYTEELQQLQLKAKQNKLNMWSETKEEFQIEKVAYYVIGGLCILAVLFVKGKRKKTQFMKKGHSFIQKGKRFKGH